MVTKVSWVCLIPLRTEITGPNLVSYVIYQIFLYHQHNRYIQITIVVVMYALVSKDCTTRNFFYMYVCVMDVIIKPFHDYDNF